MNERKEALERAYQQWNEENYQEAYKLYEDLLGATPEDAEILREYARAMYSEYDDLEQATQLFERAIAVDPDGSISALLCLGRLYSWGYGKGYQAAMGVYQRVLKLDPHNADAYIGIGMLHGRPTLSFTFNDKIESFRMVIQIAPHRVDGHMNLGMALAENGKAEDREEAIKEFRIAERLLEQSGDPQYAQTTKRQRKQLEENHAIQGSAYGNSEPMIWDF